VQLSRLVERAGEMVRTGHICGAPGPAQKNLPGHGAHVAGAPATALPSLYPGRQSHAVDPGGAERRAAQRCTRAPPRQKCARGHGVHSLAEASARASENAPGAHGAQLPRAVLLATDAARWCPGGHSRQAALLAAPAVGEYVPARQRRQSLARDAAVA